MFRAFPNLRPFLDPARVLNLTGALSKREILVAVARTFTGHPAIGDHRGWLKALYDREDVTSTGIGGGIAIPHAQHPSISEFALAIARCPYGIDFAAKDGQPVRILVMMAAPPEDRPTYLKVLASIAARLNNQTVMAAVLDAPDSQAVIDAFVAT
ncbi:MAG TPA: PTS sugar transporter subunit IIA [Planctomycetota bacterium]|nr:PTS sugar transporter subunit IIA [Planctomycetota bacterium]